MKKTILLIFLFATSILVNAQVGENDTTFNPYLTNFGNGYAGANAVVNSIAIQSDEKILIGGSFTTYNGTTINRIARLNTNGSLDTSFNPGSGVSGAVNSFAIQSDGKILIGGIFTSYNGISRNRIARLNTDGRLDTNFISGTGASDFVSSIVTQSDGKILIGGSFTSYNGTSRNRIARLNSDGSLDATFNPGTGASDVVNSIVLQSDGKILIGGAFTSCNGSTRYRIARLNTDGTLDATFNPFGGASATVNSIAIQSDGKILICGLFTSWNGTVRNHIARLNMDGTLDATFNPGTGANNTVFSIAIQSNEKILIGGDFLYFRDAWRSGIARIIICNSSIGTGIISGNATVCQGQSSVTYNVPTITNATSYIWTLPNGATGTSTTNSITVNYGASAVSGNITVKGHNDCGDGAIATLPITVNPLVASAGTISGVATACQGQSSVTYNVPTIDNATSYIWTLPNGATGTSTTNSITVNYGASAVSGNITVKGHNSCGDGAISTLPITVNPLLATAGTISGATTACQGQNSVTYNVPTIANATSYIWTLPNGATGTSATNSITVNYGASAVSGNITVKGHNSCGDGAIATLPITVNPLVASAGTISGVATACQGQNSVTYNVPTIDNATSYIWTLPNGATGISATNSITVNYGASAVSGNITVKGHNSCGDGAISTLPITVNPLPSSAGNISGTSTICLPENAVTYTVPTISNATSYIWTLPNGATGTSTTNSISVTYGTATTGNITVKGHNDCGDGVIATLPITITQTPPTPTISNIGNNVLSSSSTSGNQWYNQNGIINGAVSQNYTATANGSFYVIVKFGNCYSDSSSHIQITNTGIENNISNDVFSIYPNPTKNSLNITVDQKLIGSEFTITDQLGRTVITGKLTSESTVVEVGNLSNGIYLLRIGANAQQTFKVVKE